jgi:hypothetical protein
MNLLDLGVLEREEEFVDFRVLRRETQDLFRAVWGPAADTQWAIEHSENVR